MALAMLCSHIKMRNLQYATYAFDVVPQEIYKGSSFRLIIHRLPFGSITWCSVKKFCQLNFGYWLFCNIRCLSEILLKLWTLYSIIHEVGLKEIEYCQFMIVIFRLWYSYMHFAIQKIFKANNVCQYYLNAVSWIYVKILRVFFSA